MGQLESVFEVTKTIAATLDVQDVSPVQQPIQDRGGQHLVPGQQLGPVSHALVRRDQDRAATVAVGDQPEEEARLRSGHRVEAVSSMSSSAVDMYLRRFSRAG